jgi:hypothetical protein
MWISVELDLAIVAMGHPYDLAKAKVHMGDQSRNLRVIQAIYNMCPMKYIQ